jgi:hypothetical protein
LIFKTFKHEKVWESWQNAGSVSYISEIPNRSDSFLIKADLPGGLKTNYGHTIYFRNGLQARAEIITENRRLFHRLTGQLRKMVN